MPSLLDPEDAKNLKRIPRAYAAFKMTVGRPVSAELFTTFIEIALNEGNTVGDLADRLNVNKTSLSRNLLDLSDKLRTGEEGYGLLMRSPDPTNLRGVLYVLTQRGRALRDTIVDIMKS